MAPATPSAIVVTMPPGSWPGITSFARTPTIRPNRIQPRIVNMATSFFFFGATSSDDDFQLDAPILRASRVRRIVGHRLLAAISLCMNPLGGHAVGRQPGRNGV